MKPEDLYKRMPERIDKNVNHLYGFNYNFIPELEELDFGNWIDGEKNEKITIHYYKDFCFDGRRIWRLAGVMFEDKFVMITQNAGREGDDHAKRFITDRSTYDLMVEYLKSLLDEEEDNDLSKSDEVDVAEDIKTLDNFYSNTLNGTFNHY